MDAFWKAIAKVNVRALFVIVLVTFMGVAAGLVWRFHSTPWRTLEVPTVPAARRVHLPDSERPFGRSEDLDGARRPVRNPFTSPVIDDFLEKEKERLAEDERRRVEQDRLRAEEEERLRLAAEEQRRLEEERQRQEDEQRRAEEERLRLEAEQLRAEEAARALAEGQATPPAETPPAGTPAAAAPAVAVAAAAPPPARATPAKQVQIVYHGMMSRPDGSVLALIADLTAGKERFYESGEKAFGLVVGIIERRSLSATLPDGTPMTLELNEPMTVEERPPDAE